MRSVSIRYYVRLSLFVFRWLGVRLESLTTFVLFGTALLILFGGNLITPGAAGLCLSQALRLAGTFGVLVRVTGSVTVALLSLNRLLQYLYLPGEVSYSVALMRKTYMHISYSAGTCHLARLPAEEGNFGIVSGGRSNVVSFFTDELL